MAPLQRLLLGSVLIWLGGSQIGNGQDITIPSDGCSWRTEIYGHINQCDGNEVVVGSCGSGDGRDCNGLTHQLLCCDLDNFYYSNCLEFYGGYGVHLSCPELTKDPDTMVEAACGSEKGLDCHNGSSHSVKCCHGHQFDGSRVGSSGECYWLYGGRGQPVQCTRNDEAVFGRCGSGQAARCTNNQWHGIQCCRLIIVQGEDQ
ncbi:hypothetical protein TCAL_06201 [Tigriopus californicus]|uniref:SRCR domain-containing protein n=1 Tax=Tigriopus californicus TaxID=6832 RepID=A0A553NSL9_TIGCA|nr:uncharacterized protein LOC131882676 [Tigriopus californicus]TRY68410.1 hypothetical protein TCAL_06201 [Tigriopus californicus]|eukprot:TCALIF_06201-PA protein Name:"Protein of unknown function" AED:0.00 eAED:0.00 QI:66/1/1/1/0.33/0.5/4/103/201